MDCGIFVYYGRGIKLSRVLEILYEMQRHKYPDEKSPLGGHGAGIFWIDSSGEHLVKAGASSGDPVERLARSIADTRAVLVLGHVRRTSRRFRETIAHDWGAHPFSCNCLDGVKAYAVHNGFVRNFAEIFERLRGFHAFESLHGEGNGRIVDSEVIPHLLSEDVERLGVQEGCSRAVEEIEGNNTIAAYLESREGRYLLLAHRGLTRGLYVFWGRGELVASSRLEPLGDLVEDLDSLVSIPRRTVLRGSGISPEFTLLLRVGEF